MHDGVAHRRATFDHTLYYQHMTDHPPLPEEVASYADASAFMKDAKAKGLVSMNRRAFSKNLTGSLSNTDFYVMEHAKTLAALYQH